MAAYYRHPLSFEHETGGHPENAGRIRAIEDELEREGWHGLAVVEAPAAGREQLERVHEPSHVEAIERLCASGGGMVDLDTVVSPRSFDAALRAAGGAAAAAEALLAGGEEFAFCGLRPPGHHAERTRAMGFCLFNNAAIAAADALAGSAAERVMIVDWDVHHGNGTQDVFYDSADVLFFSIHQSPLYPGTGDPGETGEGAGEGFTVNLPVPPGSGPDEFLALVQSIVVPVGREFAPDLLIVSAGYDAHRDDPLAECMLDEAAYGDMAAALRDFASGLGIGAMACLEGGYEPRALARSVSATIAAFTDPGRAARVAPENEVAESHRRRLAGRWTLA
jgi:acetoin utilization deacetylase AcuC-like enzyme